MEISSEKLTKTEIMEFVRGLTTEQKQIAVQEMPTPIIWNEMETRVLMAEKFNVEFKGLAEKYMR